MCLEAIEARCEGPLLLAIDAYLSLGHVRHPETGCVLLARALATDEAKREVLAAARTGARERIASMSKAGA